VAVTVLASVNLLRDSRARASSLSTMIRRSMVPAAVDADRRSCRVGGAVTVTAASGQGPGPSLPVIQRTRSKSPSRRRRRRVTRRSRPEPQCRQSQSLSARRSLTVPHWQPGLSLRRRRSRLTLRDGPRPAVIVARAGPQNLSIYHQWLLRSRYHANVTGAYIIECSFARVGLNSRAGKHDQI
jgi:hypothetical protein